MTPDRQTPSPGPIERIFGRPSLPERGFLADALRTETVGGMLLLLGAAIAFAWANSPWREAYRGLLDTEVGPAALHLDLTVHQWAADGLLAVFFFVAGLELVREFTTGDLRDPAKAVLPVAAALAGVLMPAALYLMVTTEDPTVRAGWAVPVATDIAFALAVLAVIGSHLPSALRAFLLTLAVVDDLIAITIIAIFYTDHLAVTPLVGAVVPLAVFAVLVRRGVTRWWLLIPLGVVTWALVHASGVHATVAGVLLALTVPARPRPGGHPLAERLEHRVRPFSAGVAVPLFALTAAGVTVLGGQATAAVRDPVFAGVVIGLVAGKGLGVFAGTWLTARFTRARLDESLNWADVAGVSLLGGVGFTVSLLIAELAFETGSPRAQHATLAVLCGSLLAALLATVVLVRRNVAYRRLETEELLDASAVVTPDRPEPRSTEPVTGRTPGHDLGAEGDPVTRFEESPGR